MDDLGYCYAKVFTKIKRVAAEVVRMQELVIRWWRNPGSSNGRTRPFEGCYLGSNPSPGARLLHN